MHSPYWLLLLLTPFVIAILPFSPLHDDDSTEETEENDPCASFVDPAPRNPGGNSHDRRIRRRASARKAGL